jgi:FkbM family methyltransferase
MTITNTSNLTFGGVSFFCSLSFSNNYIELKQNNNLKRNNKYFKGIIMTQQNADRLNYLHEKGSSLLKEKRNDQALLIFLELEKETPKCPNTLLTIGDLFFKKGNYENTISYLSKLLSISKNQIPIHGYFILAFSLRVLGKNQEAENIFNQLCKLEPNNATYLNQRILNLTYLKDWEKSLSLSQQGIKLFPNNNLFQFMKKYAEFFQQGKSIVNFQVEDTPIKMMMTGKLMEIESALINGSFFEPEVLGTILNNFSGGVFLDVGASTGIYTLISSIKAQRVIPIEINPTSIEAIKKSVELNNFTNVDLSYLGFPLGSGTGDFGLPANMMDLSSSLVQGKGDHFMRARSLDELNLDQLDFIKVDIDGMETDFLEGAKETLSRLKPKIIIEFRKRTKERGFEIFKELNYELKESWGEENKLDCFFLPR